MKLQHTQIILIIIALSTALLGCSMLLIGPHQHISLITDFYGVSDWLSGAIFNNVAALTFIAVALLALAAVKYPQLIAHLGKLLIVISIVPLLALLGHSMWIESLGGFPAIGSGQGVIKYWALLSIGIILARPQLSTLIKRWLSVLPVLLVLIWIGGMKFTLLEAKGIEDLVQSTPLMAWMYNIWDLQTVSNIIGTYDLIAVALLIGAMFNQKLLLPAIAMAGAVFTVTQSFFITFDRALSAQTILSTSGHFLIKDLWFIANLLMLWRLSKKTT